MLYDVIIDKMGNVIYLCHLQHLSSHSFPSVSTDLNLAEDVAADLVALDDCAIFSFSYRSHDYFFSHRPPRFFDAVKNQFALFRIKRKEHRERVRQK